MYGMEQQKAAVQSGYWPLFRYNPLRAEGGTEGGRHPLEIDSRPPTIPLRKYMHNEMRFTILNHSDSAAARKLLDLAQHDVEGRWRLYEKLAALPANGEEASAAAPAAPAAREEK
jgi:pyruvate-ferredoxin/flavodoxin oxidoreductase